MKKILVLAILALSVLSCSKPEPLTPCQEKNVGYITLYNKSNNAYDVWINKKYFRQQPGETVINDIELPAGRAYDIYVKQVAGYILYPTEKTYNVTVNMCDEKEIYYP